MIDWYFLKFHYIFTCTVIPLSHIYLHTFLLFHQSPFSIFLLIFFFQVLLSLLTFFFLFFLHLNLFIIFYRLNQVVLRFFDLRQTYLINFFLFIHCCSHLQKKFHHLWQGLVLFLVNLLSNHFLWRISSIKFQKLMVFL